MNDEHRVIGKEIAEKLNAGTMTPPEPTECPKCGAAVMPHGSAYAGVMYQCFSDVADEYQPFHQSDKCKIAELTSQLAKVAARAERAERELVGLWRVAGIAAIISEKWGGTYSTDLRDSLACLSQDRLASETESAS